MFRVIGSHVRLWNLGTNNKDQEKFTVEATVMWFYRKILRIPWTALQTNVTALQRMDPKRKVL